VKLFAEWRRFRTASLVLGVVSPARATELQVAVACPAWTSEASAQVEARIRTSFLTEGLEASQVLVTCGADGTRVEVEAASGSSVRLVERRSGVLEDDVVATAQDALHELAKPPSPEAPEPEPEPEPAPAPSAKPVVAAPAPAPPTRTVLDAPARVEPPPVKIAFHVQAGPLFELWSGTGVVGAEAAVFASTRRTLALGLALGGRAALGEPESFNASEWNASARLQLAPAHAAGFQGELGLGASGLVTSPTANVTAESPTLIWTASFEARVARPFSLGSFALAPSLGVRVFSGRRDVRVNDQERLVLPVLVPQAALWLIVPRFP